jgi:hypothetical protein
MSCQPEAPFTELKTNRLSDVLALVTQWFTAADGADFSLRRNSRGEVVAEVYSGEEEAT